MVHGQDVAVGIVSETAYRKVQPGPLVEAATGVLVEARSSKAVSCIVGEIVFAQLLIARALPHHAADVAVVSRPGICAYRRGTGSFDLCFVIAQVEAKVMIAIACRL